MKINSIKKVDSVKSSSSVEAINEDESKKQVSIPVPGYKRKHAKIFYKYNRFVENFKQGNNKKNSDNKKDSDESDNNEGEVMSFNPLDNVIFSEDISDKIQKKVQWYLDELNKYNDDPCSSRNILLNLKNVDEFLMILQELRQYDLYFGREKKSIDDKLGGIMDFKA